MSETPDALRDETATRSRDDASIHARTKPPARTLTDDAAELDDGVSRIGKYLILRKLGEGGMGQVYAAYDRDLDRKVAIKLLRADYQSEVAVARMMREAQGLARLEHTNVVKIHDFGKHEGAVYIVMAYVEGQTLGAYLASRKQSSWRDVLATVIQAGHGLAAAHAKQLVHRDFKPDNVMVSDDGVVRVLDFGLVRDLAPETNVDLDALDEPDADPGSSATLGADDVMVLPAHARHLTRTGAIMGTPAYMALEQLEGRQADALTDQFAFCMVLYEALYGTRPFEGETAAAVAARMYAGEIKPRPDKSAWDKSPVPRVVHEAIVRGLAADPRARWPDMASLLAVLEASLVERKRGWVWLGLGAMGALVSLVAVATPLVRKALAMRDQTIAAQAKDLADRAAELERAAEQLERRNLELERQFNIQAGLTATLLAESPGRLLDALNLAIDVHGRYLLADLPVPLEVESGVFAATRRVHDSRELNGHTERVDAVAFSPDGRRLATAGRDDVVKLWDLDSGELLRSYDGHVDDLRSVAFSPDGARLLTTSADATATLWLVESGKVLAVLDDDDVALASFAPDGRTLALGAEDGSVSLWATAPGDPIAELRRTKLDGSISALVFAPDGERLLAATRGGHMQLLASNNLASGARFDGDEATPRNVGFSPDARTLAVPGFDGLISLRDARTGAERHRLDGGHGQLLALAFAPAGPPRLLSTGSIGAPQLWQPETGTLVAEVEAHREPATDLAFAPDGRRFATVSHDARLRIGEAASGRVLETLEGQLGTPTLVRYAPDGRRLASLAGDAVVRVWSSSRSNDEIVIPGRDRTLTAVAFSPDRNSMLAGERDGWASLWSTDEPQTGSQTGAVEPIHTFDHAGASVHAAAFGPRARLLATGDTHHLVRIWDAESFALVHTLAAHQGDVMAVAFAPDAQTLASADIDGGLCLWNSARGELLRQWSAGTSISALAFSPDGTLLASNDLTGLVSVWAVASGERKHMLVGERLPFALAFSPDGTQLAVVGGRKQIEIWELAGERRVITLVGDDPSIESVAFSPDGRRLVTGGGTWVRLWDIEAGLHLADFTAHASELLGVAFATDGTTVISASADGQVRRSIANAEQRLRRACRALRGNREYGRVERTCAAILDR